MFIMIGVLMPLGKLAMKFYYHTLPTEHMARKLLDHVLLARFKSVSVQKDSNVNLIHIEKLVARIISYFSILLSFGAIFPPLAIIATIALMLMTYSEQLLAGVLLREADIHQILYYREKLNKEASDVTELFLSSVWLIMPCVSIMHCYVVFDTLGDAHDSKPLIWVIFMLFIPLTVWCVTREKSRAFIQRQVLKIYPQTGRQRASSRMFHRSIELFTFRGTRSTRFTSQSEAAPQSFADSLAEVVVDSPLVQYKNKLKTIAELKKEKERAATGIDVEEGAVKEVQADSTGGAGDKDSASGWRKPRAEGEADERRRQAEAEEAKMAAVVQEADGLAGAGREAEQDGEKATTVVESIQQSVDIICAPYLVVVAHHAVGQDAAEDKV